MNDSWLYEKNAAFWADKTGTPANYDEIIENLRTKYGVSDSPLPRRLMETIVAFVLTLVFILLTSLLLQFILSHFSDGTLTLGGFAITLLAALSTMGGAYVCAYATFNLIAHRQKQMEKDWSDLLSKGILIEGKVNDTNHISMGERRVNYEFFDPGGKRRGYYFLTALSISISIGDKVTVWYVDSKLHTLL
jgi:hypothetical protein